MGNLLLQDLYESTTEEQRILNVNGKYLDVEDIIALVEVIKYYQKLTISGWIIAALMCIANVVLLFILL